MHHSFTRNRQKKRSIPHRARPSHQQNPKRNKLLLATSLFLSFLFDFKASLGKLETKAPIHAFTLHPRLLKRGIPNASPRIVRFSRNA
ncbi:hypothetical protein L207DRAFT_509530 [Hyaloscypha variabilis F]|uniref:Uncharacterized protein n=1 Tax=Hyaloscypha variabilis (strain UAMH 11265 / GT02V1 / F) TaxID=1149755 RepID=A0A2J6RWP6_HYAVF|nr:hypothetical protein L207DRAFT_509530 [Hyaloscypha variabilis F]